MGGKTRSIRYISFFFSILRKKHGDARGWTAKQVRYDILNMRYTEKNMFRYYTKKTRGCQGMEGKTCSMRYISKKTYFDIIHEKNTGMPGDRRRNQFDTTYRKNDISIFYVKTRRCQGMEGKPRSIRYIKKTIFLYIDIQHYTKSNNDNNDDINGVNQSSINHPPGPKMHDVTLHTVMDGNVRNIGFSCYCLNSHYTSGPSGL